ncbi:helix-turn-helix transcriptional regulator [Micromonospora sp. NPDC049559]|uniref:helix-turn-helix domain-containing protein n=1 Tax=Micromonospora sp. NPDC049559 TaxID=3155923 RepID=UPI003432FD37
MSAGPYEPPLPVPARGHTPLLRRVIGAVLRRIRLDQGRTLRDVARAADISVPYLSELERGRKEPSSEVLAAICRALGLHLADLLDEVRKEIVRLAPVAPVRRAPTLSGRPGRPSGWNATLRAPGGTGPARRRSPSGRRRARTLSGLPYRPWSASPIRLIGTRSRALPQPYALVALSADFPTAECAARWAPVGGSFTGRFPG